MVSESRVLLRGARATGTYTASMEGDLSGIILVAALAVIAGACAMLTLKLWRTGSAGRDPRRGS